METQDIINRLEVKGIKPTANRIFIPSRLSSRASVPTAEERT